MTSGYRCRKGHRPSWARPAGATVCWRSGGRHARGRSNRAQRLPFTALDVRLVSGFAGRALALELARAQADRTQLAVYDDRDRIARDLHDVVMQRLYAAGLRVQSLRPHLPAQAEAKGEALLTDLDEAIRDLPYCHLLTCTNLVATPVSARAYCRSPRPPRHRLASTRRSGSTDRWTRSSPIRWARICWPSSKRCPTRRHAERPRSRWTCQRVTTPSGWRSAMMAWASASRSAPVGWETSVPGPLRQVGEWTSSVRLVLGRASSGGRRSVSPSTMTAHLRRLRPD